MDQFRVFLADHNPILRMGLRTLIESTTDITIIGEADEGKQTLEQIEKLQPSILLLDTLLSGVSSVNIARTIHTRGLPTRVLALGTTGEREEILPLLQNGALGLILRYDSPEIMVMAIRAVARGAGFFSPAVAARLSTWMRGARRVGGLTSMELAVLRLMTRGYENKKIAMELGIKERTVEYHVSRMLGKLQLDSRTQAAIWAKERGLDKE